MLELSAVLSSDTVNKHGSRFASGEMLKALVAHRRTGLPSLVSHDAHRLGGWTLPIAVSLVPGATRLHGRILVPESRHEQAELEATYQSHLGARVEEETRTHLPTLRAALAQYLRGDEVAHDASATALIAPGLARRVAGQLFGAEDGDGLIDLHSLETVHPGVFRYGELVLFAHQYFRRSLSRWNNFNDALLRSLERLRTEKGTSVRLRLDPDMVGLAVSVKRPMEFDYWYGPKFDDDLTSIPAGVTRHEAGERERCFFGVSRTEFWWQTRDDQHILEAEEVRDLPTLGVDAGTFGCRYVHSIVDENSGRIFHLDGAIRAYDEDRLVERLDESIATAGRKTKYTKLWRTDGDIPLAHWKQLVHDHFRDNPLVGEYFGPAAGDGTQFEASEPASDGKRSPLERLVPHSRRPEDGVSYLISLHEWNAPTHRREVVPLEVVSSPQGACDVIDADTVEVRKLLRRRGDDLHIPDGVLRIAFEDRYLTLPLVRHATAAETASTLSALEELVQAWKSDNNDDRGVAFALSAPIGGVELRCSVYAHATRCEEALGTLQSLFDSNSLDEVANWVEEQASRTRSKGQDDTLGSRFDSMITPHSTYRVTRVQIPPEDIVPQVTDEGVTRQLRLPSDEGELVAAVRAGVLQAAFAWMIEQSSCSRCAQEYFGCPCSKIADSAVHQKIGKAEIAYAFWTDRSAHSR